MKWNKILGFAAATFVLVGTFLQAPNPSLAFFTAFTQASGVKTIQPLGPDTDIEEKILNKQKIIKIKNIGYSPCWVRIQVFCGVNPENVGTTIAPTIQIEGTGWTKNGDWYYYDKALDSGEETETELIVNITEPENGSDYDIIVVHECTPVLDDTESAQTADWELKGDTNRTKVKEADK